MTASSILKSIGQDHALSLLESPSRSESWDLAGQSFIRLKDIPSALHSFRRSEVSGPPYLEDYLYRLAMTLEISQEHGAAAGRYIRVYRDKDAKHRRDSLYRAVGCLHRIGEKAAITELLGDQNPDDWRDYQGLGLIAGLAFSSQGDAVCAASWFLIEPDVGTVGSSARTLLSTLIDSGVKFRTPEEIRRLFSLSTRFIFLHPVLCRKILRWIIRSGQTDALASLIIDRETVLSSSGGCLSYASVFFRESGLEEEAERVARMALILQPDDPVAMHTVLPIENSLIERRPLFAARWAKAIIIIPETADFVVNEAVITLKIADLETLTTEYLSRAADRFKSSPTLLYNVGAHFNEKALAEQAEPVLKRALLMEPGYSKAWSSYTVTKCTLLDSEQGITSSLRALAIDPRLQSGYTNLAMAYRGVGDLESAIGAGKRQLQISPNDAVARMGVAFNQLAVGAIEEGFEFYRSRWAQKAFPSQKRPFPQIEWTLQKVPLTKKVLIYMEQGMGDELMFSWFLKYAEEHAPGQIVVECDPRLIPVFQRSFPTIEFWPMTGPCQRRLLANDIMYKVPIGHLPSLFTPRLRQLIKQRWALALDKRVSGYGWIVPDLEGVSRWRNRLVGIGGEGRLCIGVSWRSGNMARARVSQYLSAEEIATSLPDNSIAVILQYVYEQDELDIIRREATKRGIDVVAFDDLDLKNDLSDVVDLCAALDGIVTPLTSTAFMGGVLGTPTWVFRTSASGSIWQQLGTPHIPWIPSIRLFFRDVHSSWDGTIQDVKAELQSGTDWILGRREERGVPDTADRQ